ncbi:MAG: beta strand repeat-containing protein, partial [Pirellulaceae bacterium]
TNSGTGAATGAGVAIAARNDSPSYSTNTASLSGLSFTNSSITGSTYQLSIANNISGVTMSGVALAGTGVGLLSYGSAQGNPASFSLGNTTFAAGLTTYVANSGASTTITGTGATFGGIAAGATLSTADGFAVSDKVLDSVDVSTFGKVILKSGNVFTTPNSFVSPATAASVQNAVSTANAGDTVWVKAGTYAAASATTTVENLTVNVPTGVTGFTGLVLGAGVTTGTLSGEGGVALTGNTGNNVLNGNSGDNVLTGNEGDDTLSGGAGNDTLSGGAGTNILNGGDGIDTAVFAGNFSDYTVVVNSTNITVTSNIGFTPASVNTLTNIEKLQFSGQSGNVLLVGPNAPYTTIQSAIDAASDGDTVLVAPGTYNESLTISKDVTVKSELGAASTTIIGAAATGETIRFTANGVTLGGVGAGFTIDNMNTADGRAIAPTSTTGGAIIGNTIVNAYRGIQGDFYGSPQNLTIEGNTFSSSVSHGLASTENMSIASISGNVFNTSVEGIGLGAGVSVTGNALDAAGIFTLLGGQTFSLSGGYALKDYRNSTIYVIQSTSIQSAINGSENLDTILVGAGTYNEVLTISKAVTVKSHLGVASTTIIGAAATGETIRFTANGVTLGGVGAG